MAYWHYCSACKQWSKSATPLSNDKVCPYCNSLLIKKKPYTNSILDKLVTEKLKEPVKSSELTEKEKETNAQNVVESLSDSEMSGVGTEKTEDHRTDETQEIKDIPKFNEPPEVPEALVIAAENGGSDNREKGEPQEIKDKSKVNEPSGVAETPVIAAAKQDLDTRKIGETQAGEDISKVNEPSEVTEAPVVAITNIDSEIMETSEKQEEKVLSAIDAFPEALDSPEKKTTAEGLKIEPQTLESYELKKESETSSESKISDTPTILDPRKITIKKYKGDKKRSRKFR